MPLFLRSPGQRFRERLGEWSNAGKLRTDNFLALFVRTIHERIELELVLRRKSFSKTHHYDLERSTGADQTADRTNELSLWQHRFR